MDKFYDILESICFCVIFVTSVILFVGRIIVVDGDSMNNTLYSGEKVFITNFFVDIEQGDIVVTDGRVYNGRPLIKRVIAIGGDNIFIDYQTGDVYVNDVLLQEVYIKEKINRDTSKANIDITVPEGCLFIMGDNRNNSVDSRSDSVGVISIKDILGKTIFRISPVSRIGRVE